MKFTIRLLAIISIALMGTSCNQEYTSPDDLIEHPGKAATVTNTTKSDKYPDIKIQFRDAIIYKYSTLEEGTEWENKSYLWASSGGKMVYDAFAMSMFFDNIDSLKTGDTIEPHSFRFSFIWSSDSNATTHEYEGKITLADKRKDYVVLHFDKVRCSCSFGDYMIDGYLYCDLEDKYVANI